MNITLPRAVIEQALEALEYFKDTAICSADTEIADETITALRTALGQQYMTNAAGELEPVTIVQTGVGVWKLEPVAWMLKSGHGTGFTEKLTEELKALTWKGKPMWTPLYDAPPQRKPEPEQEPVAWAGVDFSIDCTPPQRKPLSDEQAEAAFKAWHYKHGNNTQGIKWVDDLLRSCWKAAIEAAHGIKEEE